MCSLPQQICPELNEEQRCSQANVTKEACVRPARQTTKPDGTVVCEERTYSLEERKVVTIETPRRVVSSDISEFYQFVGENLDQSKYTEYSYFQDGQCHKWNEGENIVQGCAPFPSMAACSFACREYDVNKMEEITEEMEEEALEIGAFLFHFSIMFYMCLALALVCEDFFVASLEIIIDKLQLPPDVAGATFMAAGSSSPELFVATVAVFAVGDAGHRCSLINEENSQYSPSDAQFKPEFALPCDTPEDSLGWLTDPDAMGSDGDVAKDNTTIAACSLVDEHMLGQKIYIDEGIGVGAVVGSTMFNTLCIIGGSAVVSGKISKLDWRIILRDGTTYMVAVFTLAWVLNMPDMEEHPVLAFFSPESESCRPIKLTKDVIDSVTADHWGSEAADNAHKLSADATYCGKHTIHTAACLRFFFAVPATAACIRCAKLTLVNVFLLQSRRCTVPMMIRLLA
eukprot:COSAG02_NODE_2_length_75708_cov_87.013953_20_plen_457_part_00